MKKVGIWIRVSTTGQAESDSPQHHEKRARGYADSKDWEVVEVYHLEGVSGKSVLDHHEAKRMLYDISRGHIEGLIFSKIARLARNTKELLSIAEMFEEYGANLVSLGESIDTSTPSGRLFYTMISAMAQWERENIAERVAVTIPIRAKMGKSIGGSAPYGYAYVDGKLVLDENESPVRKRIYDLFLKHKRKATVAEILNKEGHRTRKGKLFSKQTIGILLRDPIGKGMKRANYYTMRNGKKEIKPESEWVIQPAPAIISSEKWDEVQDLLDLNARPDRHPKNNKLKLFTGYLVCHCGGKMYEPSNNKKYVCRDCKQKIPKEDLEAIFQDQLQEFILSENILERVISQGGEELNEKKSLLESIQREEEKLNTRINSLIDLHSKGQIPTEDFSGFYEEPSTRLREVKQRVAELKEEIQSLQQNDKNVKKIVLEAQDIYSSWDDMDRQDKRTIIEAIVDKITVFPDELEISIRSLLASFQTHDKWGNNLIDFSTFFTFSSSDIRVNSSLKASSSVNRASS